MNDQPELLITVEALEAHKASAILTLDLRKLTDATDFFVIASGSSNTHVRALGERVLDALAAKGRKPHHVEGLSQGRWVLLDFVDFVVHVFHPTLRDFYQLERLWTEAPATTIGSAK
jgi:ribosome-associated protein